MSRWSLDGLPWQHFDPAKVEPRLLAVVKTAALVEANAADYVVYLRNVFAGDAAFVAAAEQWGAEEKLHGLALGRWAELADPQFRLEVALADFRAGYRINLETSQSIRGSRAAELIARQIVETGTSSFYSALRDAAQEPLLKHIAGRIAQDEYFHYRLFRSHAARHLATQPMTRRARLRVALGRLREAEDDELGYAYFAANVLHRDRGADFRADNYGKVYARAAMTFYRRNHIDSGVRMLLRAVNLSTRGALFRLLSAVLWRLARQRAAA